MSAKAKVVRNDTVSKQSLKVKEGKVVVPYSRVTIADVEYFRRGRLVVECDGDTRSAAVVDEKAP